MKYNPYIKKLKKGGYGIWNSEEASLLHIPQRTSIDRDGAELIKIRMIKEHNDDNNSLRP